MDELDDVIDDALGGNPRASDIDAMIAALAERLASMSRDRDAASDPAEKRACEAKMQQTQRQIDALRIEKAASEFVEFTVRAAATRPLRDQDDIEEPPAMDLDESE